MRIEYKNQLLFMFAGFMIMLILTYWYNVNLEEEWILIISSIIGVIVLIVSFEDLLPHAVFRFLYYNKIDHFLMFIAGILFGIISVASISSIEVTIVSIIVLFCIVFIIIK